MYIFTTIKNNFQKEGKGNVQNRGYLWAGAVELGRRGAHSFSGAQVLSRFCGQFVGSPNFAQLCSISKHPIHARVSQVLFTGMMCYYRCLHSQINLDNIKDLNLSISFSCKRGIMLIRSPAPPNNLFGSGAFIFPHPLSFSFRLQTVCFPLCSIPGPALCF